MNESLFNCIESSSKRSRKRNDRKETELNENCAEENETVLNEAQTVPTVAKSVEREKATEQQVKRTEATWACVR